MKLYKILFSIVFGVGGFLAQEPLHFWPLGIFFIFYLFYTWDKYCATGNKIDKYTFIICWVVYAGGMCYWISYFTLLALFGFLVLQGLFAYLFLVLTSKIYYKNFSVLIFAFTFIVFEFVLANIPIFSFTWLNLATIPLDLKFLHNFVRAGGGELLTFFFILFSILIFKILFLNKKRIISLTKSYLVYLLIIFTVITYLLGNTNFTNKINYKVSIVQGNNLNRYLTDDEIDNNYLRKSHIELAKKIKDNPDLIVFPESAFYEDPDDTSNGLLKDLTPIAKLSKSMMIFNSITEDDQTNYYNTNEFYSRDMDFLGSYSKKRLVPFGEYVPFKNLLGSLSIFDDIGSGFSPGKKDFTINGITSLICFESTFSSDFRRALVPQTKLMVVTTNNRSYRRSGNSKQHMAQSRLRALEYSTPVVHASVSGISAIIDKDGDVKSESKLFVNKLVQGGVDTTITRSFYSKTFDWFSYCALVVVIWLLAFRLKDIKWKKTI